MTKVYNSMGAPIIWPKQGEQKMTKVYNSLNNCPIFYPKPPLESSVLSYLSLSECRRPYKDDTVITFLFIFCCENYFSCVLYVSTIPTINVF